MLDTTAQQQCRIARMIGLLMSVLPVITASACEQPITIPITNVSLADGQVRRGLPIQLGTPPQTLAFLPQWAKNNTYTYEVGGAQCPPNTTSAACITYRGGLFDPAVSTSGAETSVFDAGGDPTDVLGGLRGSFNAGNQTLMKFIKDDLSIASNYTLPAFPIGLPADDIGQQQAEPQATIGLGQNSTLLTALTQAKKILSRSYGMFYGLTGVTSGSQMDGSLTLGGFDRAKTSGRNITGPLVDVSLCRSQMMVTITGMSLNWPNRTETSVFAREGDVFRACLIPDYPLVMSLPGEVFQRIDANFDSSFTGRSTGINFWGVSYEGAGGAPYDGDLTAKVELGGESLDIRIPNDQLVLPDITIADSGAMNVNYSKQVVLLDALAAETETLLPIIGRSFLSSAYVFVNQDQDTFTLWKANATTASDLVAVASSGNVASDCGLEDGGGGSPTSDKDQAETSAPISTGAIAGIVVGGVVSLAVLALCFFFIKRRKRLSNQGAGQDDKDIYAYYQEPFIPSEPQEMVGSHYKDPHEVAGGEMGSRAEMDGSVPRYELAGHARPSELSGSKTYRMSVHSEQRR